MVERGSRDDAARLAARRTLNESMSMSVFCSHHPLSSLRPRMAAQGLVTARDLRRLPSGTTVRVAGLSVIIHTPPTRSGRRVMFVTLEDETGLMDLVVFSDLQARSARDILTCEVMSVAGRLQRTGRQGRAISIVADRLIKSWTGSLADLLPKAGGGPL
jgi:error-prone DNA polymerase